MLLHPLVTLIPYLFSNGITNAYLLYKSIAHKRYLIPLFFLLNDCMSAKSTPHILSLNCEYTFLFLNFLITGLWSLSPNTEELGFVVFFNFLKPLPVDFLSKNL